jgi:sec-independent protein translocase protein TatC
VSDDVPVPPGSDPPAFGPPEGVVPMGQAGREPRGADEQDGAEAARRDRAEAAERDDRDLARSGGGAGEDVPDPDAEPSDEEGLGRPAMTLIGHLDELRTRLMRSFAAVLVGAVVGWWLSGRALEWTIRFTVGHVVLLDPLEAFGERFKLALILGACVALPFVFYQIWAFVLPGLFRRERRLLLPFVVTSLVLFFAGAAMAVGMVVPIVLQVLNQFTTPGMRQDIRLSSLLGFIYNLALATGVVFQLPLVAGALAAMRIVTARWLLKQWRLAIVGTLVVSALITPGDVVTAQVILGIPLVLLYAFSIVVAWVVERTRRKHSEETT